jgi:hypothetical protein
MAGGMWQGRITVKITIIMEICKPSITLILGLVQKYALCVHATHYKSVYGIDCVTFWSVNGAFYPSSYSSNLSGLGIKFRKAWKLALYFRLSNL